MENDFGGLTPYSGQPSACLLAKRRDRIIRTCHIVNAFATAVHSFIYKIHIYTDKNKVHCNLLKKNDF